MSAGDNSRFSYGQPLWDPDRGEIASTSEEVGGQVTSKQDLDSLLPNYGVRHIDAASNAGGSKFLDFTKSNVVPRGCSYPSGDGITLDTVGLWRVSCTTSTMAAMYAATGSGTAQIRLELFDPDGTFVRRRTGVVNAGGAILSQNTNVVSVSMLVEIDKPGYSIRVYQLQGSAQGVESLKGEENSELAAQYVYNGAFGGV